MKLRPIAHEDQLSIIDHLDELRGRLIICGVAFFAVFCICFWQNTHLISLLNRALPPSAKTGLGAQEKLNANLGKTLERASVDALQLSKYLSTSKGVTPGASASAKSLGTDLGEASKEYPKIADQNAKPLVLGVGESFTTTLLVVAYFSVLFTLPLLLYQFYAFLLPALSKDERKVAVPTMIAAPILFVIGAGFTFFAVLPPAVHFLQGYNSNQFQILVQAGSYYKFEVIMMLGIGLTFQVPLLLLGLQKVGVITASTLTLNWRYATVIIAVIAAALPGVDPVTMTLETVPLILLYLVSILLLKWVERRAYKRSLAEAAKPGGGVAGDSSAS
jgi:sec-independent protein translocase protein TatC